MNRRNFLRIGIIGAGGFLLGSSIPLSTVKVVEDPKPFEPEYGVYYITASWYYDYPMTHVREKKTYPKVVHMKPQNTRIIPINRNKQVGYHRRTYSRAS
jgi:hypothetical protein